VQNLIPHFILEQYRLNKKKGSFKAYTMFIDMSGFTPMTQALMQEGPTGAEKLSRSLNQIFAPMVELVYRNDGFIPYFAGDAFTAVFPKNETIITSNSLINTAQQISDLFAVQNAEGSVLNEFKIGIKIGLSYGKVEWGIVGKAHKTFYFRGSAIDDCAECQHHAEGGDIILDEKLRSMLDVEKYAYKVQYLEGEFYRLVDRPLTHVAILPEPSVLPKMSKAVLDRFLPEEVIAFDQEGEFRNVVSVFCKFEGVSNHKKLNTFATVVLDEIYRFSGYFKEIDFGDKGGILLGFFGAPVSFENNIERALECVIAIRERIQELNPDWDLRYRVGITSGVAFTGTVGGEERCQYAAVGNRVNLAARLMIAAKWNSVLVDENIQKNRNYLFKHIGDIRYKGLEGNIPTYELLGRNIDDKLVFTGNMIGRQAELDRAIRFAESIFYGDFAGIYYIYGEAGIGKTRLTFELKRKLFEIGSPNWFDCQADQILKKPFNPFISFLKVYFNQSPEFPVKENIARFESKLEQLLLRLDDSKHPRALLIQKEIARTKSVLSAQVGIFSPHSLWEQLDAKGRYENTLTAIENIFKAEALLRPLVIELEDAHWYDDDSKVLLKRFARTISDFPIFLLATSRYNDDGSKPKLLEESTLTRYQVPTQEEDLNIFSLEALQEFAQEWMEGPIDEEVIEMLYRVTGGNPFYAEQILEYLNETNMVSLVNGVWNIKEKNVKVTSSINSILMARIDRLSNLAKETVKAAAVIGREFEVSVLSEVMKNNHAFVERNGNTSVVLEQQIKTAEQGQIWRSLNDIRYIFKHSLLREAVYQMQLSERLKELHRLIAIAMEKVYRDNIEEKYVDLAFHYGQAQVIEKENFYLARAADYSRRNFQNLQALDFYNSLIRNLNTEEDPHNLIKTLLKKGSVLQLIGEWEECETVFQEALTLAKKFEDNLLLGRAHNNLGRLLILKGSYKSAKEKLDAAHELFSKTVHKHGLIISLGELGNWHFRQGKYKKAQAFFSSSIELSKDLEPGNSIPQIIASLGLTYMNLGDYDAGIASLKEGLKSCLASDDKPGMAVLNTNLGIIYYEKGDYTAALEHYEKGLALSEELGNKFLTSIALGSMGSVYQKKGDFQKAMDFFIKDLELVEELGDKQGLSIVIGLIGELRSIEGDFDIAVHYLEKSLSLSEELNYQKGIAKSVNTLADVYRLQQINDKALEYYDRAISTSRKINNRLVLCSSLIEKSEVLLIEGILDEAALTIKEAFAIAKELGNNDLSFEAKLYETIIRIKRENLNDLDALFHPLIEIAQDREQQAAVYYEWFKLDPNKTTARQKAFDLYYQLYSYTPQYRYKARMEELE
jgi:class 3 adenylate cyclase/Tfp pilus assembly protein PilF